MNKLTPRLKSISEEILKGETMADIGTDHGFLPLFLVEEGTVEKAILVDISEDSLEKGRANVESISDKKCFDFRLGDGIKVLNSGEVDTVVIAGVGGILTTEILGFDFDHAHSFKKYILQPRNQIGFLRYWLNHNGFSIVKEKLVKEKDNICEILVVLPFERAMDNQLRPDSVEFEFPRTLLDWKNDLTEEYLNQKLQKERHILESMNKGKNPDPKEIKRQEYRVLHIISLIKEL